MLWATVARRRCAAMDGQTDGQGNAESGGVTVDELLDDDVDRVPSQALHLKRRHQRRSATHL
jgi:hypothetical protein